MIKGVEHEGIYIELYENKGVNDLTLFPHFVSQHFQND